jgi:hypothetical protein
VVLLPLLPLVLHAAAIAASTFCRSPHVQSYSCQQTHTFMFSTVMLYCAAAAIAAAIAAIATIAAAIAAIAAIAAACFRRCSHVQSYS